MSIQFNPVSLSSYSCKQTKNSNAKIGFGDKSLLLSKAIKNKGLGGEANKFLEIIKSLPEETVVKIVLMKNPPKPIIKDCLGRIVPERFVSRPKALGFNLALSKLPPSSPSSEAKKFSNYINGLLAESKNFFRLTKQELAVKFNKSLFDKK